MHHHEPNEVYSCPMHPEIRQDRPGMCPECGMTLVKAPNSKTQITNGKHIGHSTAMFARKFWVSLVLTIPVVVAHFVEFEWASVLAAVLGTIIFFYGGWVFLAGAWREIKGRLPGMMTLIGIAISAAYLWSVYAVFAGVEALFWELTTLVTIMLLGHWLEMRAVSGAQGALKELSKLLPDTAEVIRNGKTEVIPLSELRENDTVLVKPGTKIPADGAIIDGESDVNESMITGESKPVSKKPNDQVIAGTINGDGALKINVSNIGEKTFLAGVMRLVGEAQASKSRLQILSDRAALYLTVIAVAGGIITLIAWLIAGREISFAVARLVAVLVVACPHALGLAVPLVASISTTKAAQNGFLVKQRLALEAARTVDTVLFDKTGTLTRGEHAVQSFTDAETLRLAAGLEAHSEHIIGKAIIGKAREENLEIPEVKEFKALPGKGVQGMVEGKKVMAGGPQLLSEKRNDDQTIVYVIADDKVLGQIVLADTVREESKIAVQEIQKMGVKVAMITGDAEGVARQVAAELGIDEYFARVLPAQKVEKVKALQQRGLKVAMVGDGINDAPALAQSDLGIAIGAGTNVAIESAGIILVKNNPLDIPKILRLSKLTYRKMIQNLFWATGYNVIAVPLAAGVMAAKGIILEPALAAVFMSASTIIVAFNALLLRKQKI